MSIRSLNGLSTNNVRSLNGLEGIGIENIIGGDAIAVSSTTGTRTINVDISKQNANSGVFADTDIFLLETPAGLIKKITGANMKTGTFSSHWTYSSPSLYPNNTADNVLIGTTSNSSSRKLLVNGISEFKGIIHITGETGSIGYINLYDSDKSHHTSLLPADNVNTTITLPNISDTLIGKITEDILTNKTLSTDCVWNGDRLGKSYIPTDTVYDADIASFITLTSLTTAENFGTSLSRGDEDILNFGTGGNNGSGVGTTANIDGYNINIGELVSYGGANSGSLGANEITIQATQYYSGNPKINITAQSAGGVVDTGSEINITSKKVGTGSEVANITMVADTEIIMNTGFKINSSGAITAVGSKITNGLIDTGIADNKIVEIDSSTVADNDYAKFTSVGLEGRSYSEVKTDLSLNNVENTALSSWTGTSNITTLGTIGTGTWNGTKISQAYIDTGIANNKIVEIDSLTVADNDYAKFTANGLEGRSYSEVKTDLSLNNVENTALSTWSGSSNITTLGTIIDLAQDSKIRDASNTSDYIQFKNNSFLIDYDNIDVRDALKIRRNGITDVDYIQLNENICYMNFPYIDVRNTVKFRNADDSDSWFQLRTGSVLENHFTYNTFKEGTYLMNQGDTTNDYLQFKADIFHINYNSTDIKNGSSIRNATTNANYIKLDGANGLYVNLDCEISGKILNSCNNRFQWEEVGSDAYTYMRDPAGESSSGTSYGSYFMYHKNATEFSINCPNTSYWNTTSSNITFRMAGYNKVRLNGFARECLEFYGDTSVTISETEYHKYGVFGMTEGGVLPTDCGEFTGATPDDEEFMGFFGDNMNNTEGFLVAANSDLMFIGNAGNETALRWYDEDYYPVSQQGWSISPSGSISTFSDIRAKTNIITYKNSDFEKFKKIRTTTFKLKESDCCSENRKKNPKYALKYSDIHYGVIAQEFFELYPELESSVSIRNRQKWNTKKENWNKLYPIELKKWGTKKEKWNKSCGKDNKKFKIKKPEKEFCECQPMREMDYNRINLLTVGVVQELIKTVEEQQKEIKNLKSEIEILKEFMNELITAKSFVDFKKKIS